MLLVMAPPAVSTVHGLEAIIDAAAGVLAEESLQSTLAEMARALAAIVPYTSLAFYEVDWDARVLVPVFAEGLYVDETLADRPPLDASITGKAVLRGQVLNLAPRHPWIGEFQMPGTPYDDGEAIMVVPLTAAGRVIGTFNLWREQREDAAFVPEEAQLAQRFAVLAAIAWANAAQREQLRRQALTDELTGLYNRRHFLDRVRNELAILEREGGHLGLVLLDVDDFKAINDRFGHPAGDRALKVVADVLSASSRAMDVVCRAGGEEFAVVLPATDAEEAQRCAERLVAALRDAEPVAGRSITASAGVAVAPQDGTTADALFGTADDRLLRAKALGKDRVAAFETCVA
jgi:diguanylate cyclase (GGDEF)-like protein